MIEVEVHRKHILPLALLFNDYLGERYTYHDAGYAAFHAANYVHYDDYASYINYASYAARHAAHYALKSQAPPLIPLVYKALSL